jgi:hypothetical protein
MKRQRALGFGGVGVSVILGLAVGTAAADDAAAPQHIYVGVTNCKMCHNSAKQGAQFTIWKATKHATAYEALKTDEALKVGAARGLKKAPVDSPECLKCHATGWNLSDAQKADFLKPSFKVEDGVQCETCHGPGNDYKAMTTMKDRALALKGGLIIGDEKLCLTCHNDQSPSWKADRFTTKDGKKVGFDYEACWDKIKHVVPKAPAE